MSQAGKHNQVHCAHVKFKEEMKAGKQKTARETRKQEIVDLHHPPPSPSVKRVNPRGSSMGIKKEEMR